MLITIAIVGVAITAMGVGFMGQMLNLMVQGLITGETQLPAPITKALVDFKIVKTLGHNAFGTNFKNVITECIVQSPLKQIDSGSTIICKLTDMNHNVVAEGRKLLDHTLRTNVATHVHINDPGLTHTNVKNINDVILVVQGPKMTPH